MNRATDDAETRHMNEGVNYLLEQSPSVFFGDAFGNTLDVCKLTTYARHRQAIHTSFKVWRSTYSCKDRRQS